MLDKVRAWEAQILRLTLPAQMHTGESWVNYRKRLGYQSRNKWKKMGLPLFVEKIVDKIWMTMNCLRWSGSGHAGTTLDPGMENHFMVAEQERVEHDEGPG